MSSPRGMTGVALVTGAASGIGAACAQSFIDKGVTRLVLADLNGDQLKEHVAELQAKNPDVEILTVIANIADEDSVKAMIASAVSRFQRIDYAANCAGIGGGSVFAETSLADFDKVMDVNCRGTFVCVREELAVMLKQDPLPGAKSGREQRGSIVTIASALGLCSVPYTTAYTTAKHAVVGFTKTAAQEAGKQKVRVNCVCPGVIETPMTATAHAKQVLSIATENAPLGRDGKPEEVADVMVFLCSEEASFVTGTAVSIDGGWTTY